MSSEIIALLNNPENYTLITTLCGENKFRLAEFEELIKAQVEYTGDKTRYQLYATFDDILDRINIEEG